MRRPPWRGPQRSPKPAFPSTGENSMTSAVQPVPHSGGGLSEPAPTPLIVVGWVPCARTLALERVSDVGACPCRAKPVAVLSTRRR